MLTFVLETSPTTASICDRLRLAVQGNGSARAGGDSVEKTLMIKRAASPSSGLPVQIGRHQLTRVQVKSVKSLQTANHCVQTGSVG